MTDMHTRHNLNKIKEIVFSNEMMPFEKKQFLKNNSYTFMKNAGRMVFQFISKKFDNNQPIIVLCGPGNNGGDGFVIAKCLKDHGYTIDVYILGYDNNKSMRNGRQRIYGGAGALPLWTDFSKRVLEVKEYDNWIDFLDLS